MNLHRLTDQQLYRLSFDISEELVEREQKRLRERLAPKEATDALQRRLAIPRPTYVFNSADDNYGAW